MINENFKGDVFLLTNENILLSVLPVAVRCDLATSNLSFTRNLTIKSSDLLGFLLPLKTLTIFFKS